MTSKIKNIIIFVVIAAVLALAYFLFIRGTSDEAPLVSSTPDSALPGAPTADNTTEENAGVAADFLALLLNVKNIKLDDTVLSDIVFAHLRDSTINLDRDTDEGRPNPFAPFGAEGISPSRS